MPMAVKGLTKREAAYSREMSSPIGMIALTSVTM